MNDIKIILKEFSEKPIAYQPIYSKITGSITAGILLSQLVYWYFAMGEKEFYKTNEDFCNELAMGLWELKGAKKKLKELKIIEMKIKGIPAKTYYKINIKKIIALITNYSKTRQLDGGKPTNWREENQPTITENTTENTHPLSAKADEENFSFDGFLQEMKTNKQRHIQIIRLYWLAKKRRYENRKQADSAIRRDLKAASALAGYSDEQIQNTMKWLNKNFQGGVKRWTLETVGKYIDDYKNIKERRFLL